MLLADAARGGLGQGDVERVPTDQGERAYHLLSAPDPEVPDWEWPKGGPPFCYWGCQVYSCAMPDGNGCDWGRTTMQITGWLSLWVDGRLGPS